MDGMKSGFAVILLLVSAVVCRAESFVEDIPDMHVNAMVQDVRGYIWIGTENGLFRFNGRNYSKYYGRDDVEDDLPSNRVVSLALDRRGRVWIATDAGMCIYDENGDRIRTVPSAGPCTQVISCRDGIACCGGHGLTLFDDATTKEIFRKSSELHDISILCEDKDAFWGGSSAGDMLIRYNSSLEPTRTVVLPDTTSFLAMAAAPDSSLWIGCRDGLIILRDGEFSPVPEQLGEIIEDSPVTGLIATAESIYVCITLKGIVKYDFADGTITKGIQTRVIVNRMSDVSCGLFDREGRLWIGTRDRGIGNEYLVRKNFNISQYLRDLTAGKYINCAAASSDGNTIWLGSIFKGILGYDVKAKSGQWYDYNKSGVPLGIDAKGVSAMMCTDDGRLWYSAEGRTYVCTTSGNRITERELVSEDAAVTVFCEGRDGTVWGGSKDGLYCWKNHGNQSLLLQGQAIQDIALSADGRLLVSAGKGTLLSVGSDGTVDNFALPEELGEVSANCIHCSESGDLWLGTFKNEIIRIGADSLQRYRLEDIQGPTSISSITEDMRGNIWVSTNHGLCAVTRQYDHPVFFTGNELETVQHFTAHSLKSCGPYIVCGGNTGALLFRPERILNKLAPNPPTVVFSELLVNNEPLAEGRRRRLLDGPLDDAGQLVLPHRFNNFELVLDAINFNPSINGRLFYRLSGKRQKGVWTECGRTGRIPFFGLPSGTYTLEILSGNDEGFFSKNPRTLNIKVKTPFLLSVWMIMLYLCMLALSIWVVFAFLSRRMQERLRLENVEMKLNFFGNISHELRTYLTLIYSPVNMISKAETTEEREKLINLINHNTTKLIELVDQLLVLNRIESSALPLNVSLQSPDELISFSVSLFEASARRKGVELTCECSIDSSLRILLDADKLSKILSNLLSNAIKYTLSGGHILLTASIEKELDKSLSEAVSSDSYLVISVKDDGIGMKPGEISGIFDRYTRLENAEFVSTGSGIGLHYTSQLVKMHKGAIAAKLNPDRGMTFSIAIPTDAELYSGSVSPSSPGVVNGLPSEAFDMDNGLAEEKEDTQLTEKATGLRVSILLVEDNVLLREFVKSILCPSYDVHVAADGAEALDLVEDLLPDLVITDVMMPRLDGLSLSRRIKDNPALSHIPVIMLTAKTDEKDKLEGYANGADVYLTKPFNSDVLLSVIANIISSRDKFREKILEASSEGEIEEGAPVGEKDRQFLGALIQYIDRNLSNGNVDILSLSGEMCMSRSSLFRKLRSLTGMTPNSFVNSYRLNKAAGLLRNGDYRVSEVCDMLGFKSASYFAKAFKQQFGVSPSEYLNSKQK